MRLSRHTHGPDRAATASPQTGAFDSDVQGAFDHLLDEHQRRFGDRALSLDNVVTIVEAQLGRDIVFLPAPITRECGLLAESTSKLFVFYAEDAPKPLLPQIQAHELSHLILGHHGETPAGRDENLLRKHFPDLADVTVLRRSSYDDENEAITETLATMMTSIVDNPLSTLSLRGSQDRVSRLFGAPGNPYQHRHSR